MVRKITEQETLSFKEIDINRSNSSIIGGSTVTGEYEQYLLKIMDFPTKIDMKGICICLRGECEISINMKNYIIKKNDLLCVFPGTIIQIISKSDDFEGYTMVTNVDFMESLNIPSGALTYLHIKENPCISLKEDDKEMIIDMLEEIKERDERANHPFRKEIAMSILSTLCFEIAAIYLNQEPIVSRICSRKESLFRNFLLILSTDYAKERSVDYYAQKLMITPKYLSVISNEITGKGASIWITDTVIINAKCLLKSHNYSIKEVSGMLNFPNPSFFGQFFKRHTGVTPKEYQLEILKSNN